MSVHTVASLMGEPRAVFTALEHHWRDHPPAGGLQDRTVAHGPGGFLVIETWEDEASATAAWAVIRLEGIPAPDTEVYGIVARTGPVQAATGAWSEVALPADSVWEERVVPRDS